MATVTNLARAPRGFVTLAGLHVIMAPGQTSEIDVPRRHAAHDAWVSAGHAVIVHAEPETLELTPADTEETVNVGKRNKRAANVS
jgi:hypothetical protein